MATVTKDFKVKAGLVVEGANATVGGYDVLKKDNATDEAYIVNLIGGETLITSVSNEFDVSAGKELSIDRTTVDAYYDAAGSANTAEDNAIAHTDARETAITTAYQSYADTAEADAITAANAYTDTAEGREQTNRNNAIANAISDLDLSNTYDAKGAAAAAEASANSYTDDEIGSLDLSLKAYADDAETDAIATASADATSKANAAQAAAEATASADATSKANAAQAAAELTASNANSSLYTTVTGDIATAKSEAILSANGYTDQKVTDLIGGAPGILDTLNELAEAIGDDANFITTIEGQIALKADLSYVNNELSDLNSEAQGYASAAQSAAEATASADATSKANAAQAAAEAAAALDATSKADAAESDANIYTDGKITEEVADRNSAISSAIDTEVTNRNSAINSAIGQEVVDRNSAITTAVDALDTDDIEEGTNNLYFTNQRAIDAVGGTIGDQIDLLTTDDIEEGINNEYFTAERATDAVALALANGSHQNIAISYSNGEFSFQAENGVADSTTTDLAEGTNLYFTDARAVSALEAVVPNFTEIDINEVATQVAASSTGDAAQNVVAYQFATADYRSAKFLVKVAYGTHTEVSEVLLTLDTSDNVAITEYAIVGTNGSAAAVSADVSGGNVRLLVTPTNNGSTINVMGTLLV